MNDIETIEQHQEASNTRDTIFEEMKMTYDVFNNDIAI